MKTDKPLLKSFVCAGVVYAAVATRMFMSEDQGDLEYRLGGAIVPCLIAGALAAIWADRDQRSWPLWRFALTVVGFYLLISGVMLIKNLPR